ncbi:hypothetical protein MSG28_001627, partial [Choristoneura fumiferana]
MSLSIIELTTCIPDGNKVLLRTVLLRGRRWTEVELDEDEEAGVSRSDSTSSSGQSECAEEFRARASTDSRLPPRPARLRHPPSVRTIPPPVRRMSVAMRGNNARTILFYLLRCHYNSHTAGLLKGLIVYVGFTDMAKVVLANGHWMNGGVGGTMSITTSPKSSLAKLGLYPKPKPFKIMVLGQSGVGKSALVVRFITRRFIGEYDPNLEKIYAFQTVIDNEMVYFEILDSAGDPHESEYTNLESNIRWAEAFILMYSVTDKCSFDECHRLKFLINYNKRRRRIASSMKWSRGRVASADSEVHPSTLERPLARAVSDTTPEPSALCRRWTEVELDEDEEAGVSRSDSTSSSGQSECAEEFRARASTDSRLPPRPARLRHPPSVRTIPPPVRRMSVAMRGNNARTIYYPYDLSVPCVRWEEWGQRARGVSVAPPIARYLSGARARGPGSLSPTLRRRAECARHAVSSRDLLHLGATDLPGIWSGLGITSRNSLRSFLHK